MDELRTILDRRRRGKQDNYRVALCLDSGGMKGAAVGGMAEGLDDLGLLDCFDDVYGTSSGAIVGAYLLAGDREKGAAIFWEHLSDKRFIRPAMTPIGGAMHMNYLFDSVLLQREPLDLNRLQKRGVPFHPLVANRAFGVRDGAEVFDLQSSLGMMSALRSAVRVPIVCGNPWSRVPDLWLDAGLHEPTPFQTPLNQGATHLLLLRSAPRNHQPAGALDYLHHFFKRTLARPIAGTSQAGRDHQQSLFDSLPQERLQQVYPLEGPEYSFFCRDPFELQSYARAGFQAVKAWFAGRPVSALASGGW